MGLTGLAYYSAEKMSIARLKQQVCDEDAETCRICDCLDACAYGKRYIALVEAGVVVVKQPKPKVAAAPRADRRKTVSVAAAHAARFAAYEAKVRILQEGLANNQTMARLYKVAGYKTVKQAQDALRKFKKKYGGAVAL